ncbi:MAG: DUF4870 domain-containing protein [Anaerolineales bacterium]|jgi:uncharacterized membrane protein|nr:DUF4870 domain-containing protein [Anaerolineales bacterium]MBX3004845.1 DUF4870 domain-containing protein [Anaerolineales bacterium]MCW5839495.1 DUF4870 domain-containing protein [Anaerolineales bacterium]MCW5856635.1 DUF4870 domain-containing protein [Anaerolineales bacterium]MCW5888168.1 DUF4870 domain-containing protein [Anaerolineales bacterium]
MAQEATTDNDKLLTLLAYVFSPLVPVVLMLMNDKKDRPYIKQHNAQALVWGVLSIVLGYGLGSFLCGLPGLVMWVIAIYWGIQAYNGKDVVIPVITDFVKSQGWA